MHVYPPTEKGLSFGKPPFAVDDGTDYYAVIDKDGNVAPLPFGCEVPTEDLQMDGVDVVFSKPMPAAGEGVEVVRYMPLAENFEMPGERAFCLETFKESAAFGAVGDVLDALQEMVTEKALFNFNQRLANTIVSLYGGYEELESVDQAVAALFVGSSVLPALVLRSYQHALDVLEEEMSAEKDD